VLDQSLTETTKHSETPPSLQMSLLSYSAAITILNIDKGAKGGIVAKVIT
jgi:hypothetical protein